MNKRLYGIYVIWLALLLKTLKKNNKEFQAKVIQAVMKYSAMVILITLTIGCTVPGSSLVSDIPGISEEEPKFTNWKSGIPTPTPTPEIQEETTEETTEETAKTIPTMSEVSEIPEAVLIKNNRFQEPPLICNNPGCPYLTRQIERESLEGWIVKSGSVALESTQDSEEQYLNLNGDSKGILEQVLETKSNSIYSLSFQANMSQWCSSQSKDLVVFWNDIPNISIDINSPEWTSYNLELRTEINQTQSRLAFQSLTPGPCGPSIDNINLFHTNTILAEIDTNALTENIPGNQLPIPTPTPTPPEAIPTIQVVGEETNVIDPTPIPDPGQTEQTVPSKYITLSDGMNTLPGNAIDYRNDPEVSEELISFNGYIVTKIEPSSVQIWNLQGTAEAKDSDAKYDDEECSTEHPTIFFRKPADLGYRYTEEMVIHEWDYCVNEYKIETVTEVPWEDATIWEFNPNDGYFKFQADKTPGKGNEYEEVDKWVIVVVGSEGLISRREVQN